MPSFEGNFLIQRHQITSLETRNSRLPYGGNPESLSHLGLILYRVVTPRTERQTDRIAIANTRSAVPAGTAVARENEAYIFRFPLLSISSAPSSAADPFKRLKLKGRYAPERSAMSAITGFLLADR